MSQYFLFVFKQTQEWHASKVHPTTTHPHLSKEESLFNLPCTFTSSYPHSPGYNATSNRCKFCPKTFLEKTEMAHHLSLAHSYTRGYCCPECGKWFSRKEDLQGHLNMHTGEKTFACKVCGKAFHYAQSQRKHEKMCTFAYT